MSLQRPLQQGRASSRSQQVYHSCWVSQGTSGFSGHSLEGEERTGDCEVGRAGWSRTDDVVFVVFSMHVRNAVISLSVCLSVYLSVRLPTCLSVCLSICLSVCLSALLSHLLNSGSPPEEEVPLWVCDLPGLPHDLSAQHEGKHQLVLLKETPV